MDLRRGTILALMLALAAGACDDDLTDPVGPFDLTFSADATFQGAHGGQTVRLAVLSEATGAVVASEQATVASSGASSFSFTFLGILQEGETYQIHYWIDSNFGETGNTDVCDGTDTDHQWALQLADVQRDAAIQDTHRPTQTADVCATFAADLTFQGDASFQTAHGGQTLRAAVVRPSDGAVLWTQETIISSDQDPSFQLEFPGALLYDDAFEIHYWIDSNFAGGTQGTCDPPVNDHQWSIDLGQPDAPAMLYEDTHRPTETEDVCATFQ